MLHLLLFSVILVEAALIMALLFKTPVRKLVIAGLDCIKCGHGPIVVKTVAVTVLVVLISTLYSVLNINNRWVANAGDINPTDQILMAKHLLDASLMGFFLFLALMLDRLHHYIRELHLRSKSMEVVKKSEGKFVGAEDMKAREEQVGTFKAMIQQLESELEKKTKEANNADADISALRKQSEGLLHEYDRLLAENQGLRSQLQLVDQQILSHSPSKKNS
ncbi:hypothetical protein Ancab_004863 [Ancistrocladus abbreviatus]